MNTVISKNSSTSSSTNLFWIISAIICSIALCVSIWAIHDNNQHIVSLMAQYNELRTKPYVTLQENKKIFNQANMADGDADNIIEKMDGTTVVDNKNGHEYLVNATPSHGSFGNAQYQLVAKMNGKSAAINKAWLKDHGKE